MTGPYKSLGLGARPTLRTVKTIGVDERVTVAVGTPFGEALKRLIESTPGAMGAVLSDDHGDPIDYAFRSSLISELDIQLCGAQLALLVHTVGRSCSRRSLGPPLILLEGDDGALLAGAVGPGMVVVLRMRPRANLAAALAAFEAETAVLAQALFG